MSSELRQALLVAALLAVAGCGAQTQEQRETLSEQGKAAKPEQRPVTKSAPPKPLSADAEVPTGERGERDKEKEQRGNTPPGMDRSGGGPASGAIVDPAGVVTK